MKRRFDFNPVHWYNWVRCGGLKESLFRFGWPKKCFMCHRTYWYKMGHQFWDEAGVDSMCSGECQTKYAREFLG